MFGRITTVVKCLKPLPLTPATTTSTLSTTTNTFCKLFSSSTDSVDNEKSENKKKKRPVVLTILDGWGYREDPTDNAVLLGETPHFDRLYGHHSACGQVGFLDACERDVGLPVGQIGNSEVGHMNIGAGRVVWQDICTIDNAIKDNTLVNDVMEEHIEILKETGGTCHLLGLVSPGGVHSMDTHIAAVANAIHDQGVPVVIHAFTDGRDVPPNDAIRTFPEFLNMLHDGIQVGTVTGRYYAMDRDNRWERVLTAYDVIVNGNGIASNVNEPMEAIKNAYDDGKSDEFILPTCMNGYDGMKDGDGIFMANFRSDRAREIMTVLAGKKL
jgi:2,3-bisphosphoglycerate-independent phosphoglycerate mutase